MRRAGELPTGPGCRPSPVGGPGGALSGGGALAAPLHPTELLSSTALPGAWDTRFGSVSAPGPVTISAFAVSGSNVFAGGVFTNLGGVTATNLARWDGSSWTNMGNGFDGPVYALAWDGTNLYVGGQFNTADTVGATNIAKWNGKAWSGLDTGFDGPVYAIAVAGTNLIAGGAFANASGAGVANVAQWTGTNWAGMGDGMNGQVSTVVINGSTIFAGGQFTSAGGTNAFYVAQYVGTNWLAVGAGFDGPVNALAFYGSNLVAGGAFRYSGGTDVHGLAGWNGASWLTLGLLDSDTAPVINALAVGGNSLYAGGQFQTLANKTMNNIARYDGNGWQVMSSGVNGTGTNGSLVTALGATTTQIMVGGQFDFAGEVAAQNIAAWNRGNAWRSLGTGLVGYANAAALTQSGQVIVGGSFTQASTAKATNVARFDGTNWFALGGGVDGPVSAVAVVGNSVYVGGIFASAGGVSARSIARWDGTNWFDLAGGVDGPVYALLVSGTDVYVGGSFSHAGGLAVANLARWDGSSWNVVGAGVGGPVYALAQSGSLVLAGGAFTNAGAVALLNIASWNGKAWSPLAGGVGSTVYAIATAGDGSVFVGGDSGVAGVIDGANNVAKWDGTHWTILESGVNGTVRALLVRGSALYAGGSFTLAGDALVMNFARWEDAVGSWASLGDGTNNNGVSGNIFALVNGAGVIYVAGIFTPSGGGPAINLASYTFSGWAALGNGLEAGVNDTNVVAAVAATAQAVYVGGSFSQAGGVTVSNLAKWDGTGWSALGAGLNGEVDAIAVSPAGGLCRRRFYGGGQPPGAGDREMGWHPVVELGIGSGRQGPRAGPRRDDPLCGRRFHPRRRFQRQRGGALGRHQLVPPEHGRQRQGLRRGGRA